MQFLYSAPITGKQISDHFIFNDQFAIICKGTLLLRHRYMVYEFARMLQIYYSKMVVAWFQL